MRPDLPRVMVVGPGPEGAGGIAVVIGTLAKSSLADRYELVHVRTHRDGGRLAKGAQGLAGIAHAASLLARRRVDVVYLHASSGFSLRRKSVIAALARLARRPYIVHVHAGDFDRYYADASSWERALVRRTLSGAVLVVALTQGWVPRLRSIAPCQTAVIPNPVLIPAVAAGGDDGPATVVSLGRLGPTKGTDILLRAFAAVAPDHPDATLILAGDGDLASAQGEADRLGIGDRVRLTGWIAPADRERLLSSATVFALPSREEGLPVALLEAMSFGLPVVTTPVGGIPEVVTDGRHGFLVPRDDAEALAVRLRQLLDDPAGARRMGQLAREDARRRFAVDVVADHVAAAIDTAVGNVGPAADGRRSRNRTEAG